MSLCPQNKRNEALGPLLRLNAYTLLVSFFLHILCGIAFLMSQGHLATGNSFIVFGTASSQAQRVFFKTPPTGKVASKKQSKSKPQKKKKQKKRKEKKKVLSKKAAKKALKKEVRKKKSFPEKPATKKNKKKNALAEKSSAKEKKAAEEIKKEVAVVIEEPVEHDEIVVEDAEVVAVVDVAPAIEEIVEPELAKVVQEEASDEDGEFDVVVGADQGDYGDATVVNAQRYIPFVQREIYRLWNPPVGVGLGTKAILKVVVAPSGKVDDFEIVTPSGCLIFDMSIERIADKFAFDACLWGKTFTVEFRQ